MVTHAGVRCLLDAGELREAVDRARTSARPWEAGRKSLERAVVHGLMRQLEIHTRRAADNQWAKELKRKPAVKEFLGCRLAAAHSQAGASQAVWRRRLPRIRV